MYARVDGDLRADLTIRLMFRRDRPYTGGGGAHGEGGMKRIAINCK